MADEIIVNDLDIENALLDGLADNTALKRACIEFIDDAADTWKMVWEASTQGVLARETGIPHPYQTGDYVAHIKKRRVNGVNIDKLSGKVIRKALADGALIGSVYNDSDVAHFIEYGTDIDAEGTHSPWGRFTETPKFEIAKRTAEIMGGRADL